MPKTYVTILLDNSGSMWKCKFPTIKGYNDQIAVLKEDGKLTETLVSLLIFNSAPEFQFKNKPVESLTPMEVFETGGGTAWYDALGAAMKELDHTTDVNDEDNSYLVMSISDGEELNSKAWTAGMVADEIDRRQKTNRWTFTYLAASNNLDRISELLHIPRENCQCYVASSYGTTRAWAMNNSQMRLYLNQRSQGIKSVKKFYSPESQVDAANMDLLKLVSKKGA